MDPDNPDLEGLEGGPNPHEADPTIEGVDPQEADYLNNQTPVNQYGADNEEPDVWDTYSQQILAELKGLASGDTKSMAEQQAETMGKKFATASYAVAKSRRGVAPGAMFAEGARQASLADRMGRQQSKAIGKQTQETARTQLLQFQASKEAERRGLGAQYAAMQQQARIAAEQASAGLFGSFMGFLGSIGAGLIAAFSDERLKTNIDRGRGKADLMEFLNTLDVATYDKHVFGHHRHETGIMAQSAERSKVGRQFVKEVKGYKSIDANAATGPILASLKFLHDRLDDLEKPKKKKRGKK